jgi:TrmH family RNA methyltransferase
VVVVEGPTMLVEALDAGLGVEAVFVERGAPGRVRDAVARAEATGGPIRLLAEGTVARVADLATPPPVLSVVAAPAHDPEAVLARRADGSGLVVVLAGVGDPGNAGTLVRAAEAADATGVVALAGTVDLTNPKAVRAAAGSLFRVPTWRDAPVEAVTRLRDEGWQVTGTAADAPADHDAVEWAAASAVVLGSEAHGVPEAVAPLVGRWVRIPMAGGVESLNVALAGALVAYEATRGRRRGTPSGPSSTGSATDLAGPAGPGRVAP